MANGYYGRALISFGKQKLMPMSVTVDLCTERQPIEGSESLFILSWGGSIENVSFDTARMMIQHIGELVNITISKGKERQARLDLIHFQYREEDGKPVGVIAKLTGINKPPY